jgi:hypothetical protein
LVDYFAQEFFTLWRYVTIAGEGLQTWADPEIEVRWGATLFGAGGLGAPISTPVVEARGRNPRKHLSFRDFILIGPQEVILLHF